MFPLAQQVSLGLIKSISEFGMYCTNLLGCLFQLLY
jgi:hypothetical protein